MNVFEGSYMNSSYSAHAAHTNEYIYNFLRLSNKWQRDFNMHVHSNAGDIKIH